MHFEATVLTESSRSSDAMFFHGFKQGISWKTNQFLNEIPVESWDVCFLEQGNEFDKLQIVYHWIQRFEINFSKSIHQIWSSPKEMKVKHAFFSSNPSTVNTRIPSELGRFDSADPFPATLKARPPDWWSNNLLSMVPCVVLCHWWWLEPHSNVAGNPP